MNKLKKELCERYGRARMFRFYNIDTNKTINYKVYDNNRKLIVTTDDKNYAHSVLIKKGSENNESGLCTYNNVLFI